MKHRISLIVALAITIGSMASSSVVVSATGVSADNSSISEILGTLMNTNPYADRLSQDIRSKLDAFMNKAKTKKYI